MTHRDIRVTQCYISNLHKFLAFFALRIMLLSLPMCATACQCHLHECYLLFLSSLQHFSWAAASIFYEFAVKTAKPVPLMRPEERSSLHYPSSNKSSDQMHR